MLLAYSQPPLLVDLPDAVVDGTVVKRRARRRLLTLPDTPDQPCKLEPEVIYYARLADGSYGDEMPASICPRHRPQALTASPWRLVNEATGAIVASRWQPDGRFLTEAEWATVVAQVDADTSVTAMPQNLWFCRMLRYAPVVVDQFIEQYLLLADASGDLS